MRICEMACEMCGVHYGILLTQLFIYILYSIAYNIMYLFSIYLKKIIL